MCFSMQMFLIIVIPVKKNIKMNYHFTSVNNWQCYQMKSAENVNITRMQMYSMYCILGKMSK